MENFKILFLYPFLLLTGPIRAQSENELDKKLQNYIQMFKFEPVNKLKGSNQKLYYLGKSLFAEKALSGKRNISCLSCHDPSKGTGDFFTQY